MDFQHYYEVTANWISDRRGSLSSEELSTTLEVATPPPFPGGIPDVWSPEHYLIASVNSCLMTTFLAIAENSKLTYKSFQCKAIGNLEKVDGKYMISEIELQPLVVVFQEQDIPKAERILHKSEAACLISNSIKSKISMKPEVHVEES